MVHAPAEKCLHPAFTCGIHCALIKELENIKETV